MELSLSIPALLFPAISLSMLAYNARYLAIAALIRELHRQFRESHAAPIARQIRQLTRRLRIIKGMQSTSIASFLLAAVSMFLIYVEFRFWASAVFGLSLILLMASLVLSFLEVQLSTRALEIQLRDMEGE